MQSISYFENYVQSFRSFKINGLKKLQLNVLVCPSGGSVNTCRDMYLCFFFYVIADHFDQLKEPLVTLGECKVRLKT